MKQSSVAHKPATPSLKRTKIGGTPLRSSCRPSTIIASQQCSGKADSQKNNNLAPEFVPEIVSISSLRLLVPPTETVKDTEGSPKVTSLSQTDSDALTTQPVGLQHVPEFPGTPTIANDAEDHPPLSSNIPLIDAPAPTRTPLPTGCNLSDVIATPLRSRAPVRRMIRTRKFSKGLFINTCESAPPQSPTGPEALWPHFLHADLKLAVNRATNSAPNSPGVDGFSSFGRLSLRRRAIPHLPVTPSRRVLRTPNARLTPKKVTPKARTPISSKPQVMEPDTVKNSHMSFPSSPVNSACDPSNTQSPTSSQQVFSDSDKQSISPRPPPPDTTSCPTIPVSVPFPE
ncbi:unnamed protein product [Calicophoron daubneyi]|uniref:Uncharacterized protein n=1 Tax=Calicophoron daubneyi TaxID=300641 RepID=A0AAV2TB31_CALDB